MQPIFSSGSSTGMAFASIRAKSSGLSRLGSRNGMNEGRLAPCRRGCLRSRNPPIPQPDPLPRAFARVASSGAACIPWSRTCVRRDLPRAADRPNSGPDTADSRRRMIGLPVTFLAGNGDGTFQAPATVFSINSAYAPRISPAKVTWIWFYHLPGSRRYGGSRQRRRHFPGPGQLRCASRRRLWRGPPRG